MTGSPDEESTAIDEDAVAAEAAEHGTEPADEVVSAAQSADEAPGATEPADALPANGPAIDGAAMVVFGLIAALALTLALAAGWLTYVDHLSRQELAARKDSVRIAKDSTIAMLSYQPDKVEEQLEAARARLTGAFKDQYVDLTTNVVIPGAKQKQISAVATVPQAASVSAGDDKAVVLVFINQTVAVGGDAPTSTASSVRVTLERVGDAWLISKFDPI